MSSEREREDPDGQAVEESAVDDVDGQVAAERGDQTLPTGGPDLPKNISTANPEGDDAKDAGGDAGVGDATAKDGKKSPFESAFEDKSEDSAEDESEDSAEDESEDSAEDKSEDSAEDEAPHETAKDKSEDSAKDEAPHETSEGAKAEPAALVKTTEPDDAKAEPDEAVEAPGAERVVATYFGITDVGLIREHNEDNFTIVDLTAGTRGSAEDQTSDTTVEERGIVFAVCDGMGGAAAGEVASQMAVDTIYEFFTTMGVPKSRDHFALRVVSSIEEAGNRIFSAAKMDRTRRGMGTTATVAGLMDKVLFVGQVGDSRAYILRNEHLAQITKDQSLVNQLIEAGQLTEEEAEAFEHSNIILQALGTTEEVAVDLTFLELRTGDRLMMCSDGLSGLVHPDMIKDVLVTEKDLVVCAKKLIEMANAGGGHDNITCVVVDFDGEALVAPQAEEKATYQQYPLPAGLQEERESLPPREMRIKQGGPKPGADVKGSPYRSESDDDDDDDAVAVAKVSRPADASRPMTLVLIIVAILVLLALVFVAMHSGDDQNGEGEGGTTPASGAATDTATVPTIVPDDDPIEGEVEVRVVTDIEGELFVDGESQGPLDGSEDAVLFLVPGAYRLEARSGDSVVAHELVTVTEGTPLTVSLTMPTGTTDTERPPGPQGTEIVEESGGTTGRAEGGGTTMMDTAVPPSAMERVHEPRPIEPRPIEPHAPPTL